MEIELIANYQGFDMGGESENEVCETGVGAIMKACAACAYYNYTKAVVYSTSKFTNEAKAMAEGLGVGIVSVSPWR